MQNITSKNTSINSKKAPSIYSNKKAIEIMRNKKIIDIGGGKYPEPINRKANEYNAIVSIYDKYNQTIEHNKEVLKDNYDIAVISNVLNVINSLEERKNVVRLASEKANTILITVYEGDKSGIGRKTGCDSWQENRKLETYIEEIKTALPHKEVVKTNNLIIVRG